METIKDLHENVHLQKGHSINLNAWVVSNRSDKNISFITINDGSTINSLQVVVKEPEEKIKNLKIGAAINVIGEIVLTPQNSKQKFELHPKKIIILKDIEKPYPIQNKKIKFETLRLDEYLHLRHRTNTFRAIMRVRSTLAFEIHNFFHEQNFLYLNSPIITSNDGEGAGETFKVVTSQNKEFFGKNANLCVTGQLHGEAYALGFQKIYTFGPTFRAEISNTQRHMAEFWMIEPEVAFADLQQIIDLASTMLKTVIAKTMESLKPEFAFLNDLSKNTLIEKLQKFLSHDLQIVDYKDAIKALQDVKHKFENQNIKFGIDLASEHEKYLCEKIFQGPVAIINYPKAIKAFYMHQNDDNLTVAAFDLLVPGVGELVGGSQRETDYHKLQTRIKELNINENELSWYTELRQFGDAMSSGFGVGFERLIMFITGIENIRDTIPFPRTNGNLKM